MSVRAIYIAARFSRQAEVRDLSDEARAAGFLVTSRWPYIHETDEGLGDMGPDSPAERFADDDLTDVLAADALISLTEGGGGRGGRHVEFGIALAARKTLVVVGPREHIFHSLAHRVDSFDAALGLLNFGESA